MVRGTGLRVTCLSFAIPGDIDARTGGYAYDRRILRLAPAFGATITHIPLAGRFPQPTEDDVARAIDAIRRGRRQGDVLLVDGLAWGALPESAIARIQAPVMVLCHHPLCLETGLDPMQAAALEANERNALARAAHVIVTSPHTARTLEGAFGVPSNKISVAVPGVDRMRRSDGQAKPLRLLAVGSIIPRKAFDILIEALAGLVDLDWSLTIAGGHEHAPETTKALRTRIDALGLSDRVDLPGDLHRDALQALFAGAGLFVSSSLYEGYGMALAEAVACGLPIVATTGGATAETIPCGAALTVPPGDMHALRAALRRAVSCDDVRRDLRAASWRAAQSLPRWEDAARIVVEAANLVRADAS